MDRIIRGISRNARFFVTDTTEIVREALVMHQCTPGAIYSFGKFLTAGIIMGATLKGEDVLTLRTDTDGLVGQMLLTVNAKGDVKGYIQNPGAQYLQVATEHKVSDFLGTGALRVIKDMGLKDPYSGVSDMTTGDLAQDIAYYYHVSEQIPTVISLGVSIDGEGNVVSAGGYMIQLLPDADDDFIDKLEEKIKAIRSFTELRNGGMDLERIIHLLYEDMEDEKGEKLIEEYEILEGKKVQYLCNCSREKFHNGVITLGKKEIDDIIHEKGSLDVECHFCRKIYSFNSEDFKDMK
ncbi:MAG: Hsp33 family molecular chaperone HslO [Fusobacteriaceae bacterium]